MYNHTLFSRLISPIIRYYLFSIFFVSNINLSPGNKINAPMNPPSKTSNKKCQFSFRMFFHFCPCFNCNIRSFIKYFDFLYYARIIRTFGYQFLNCYYLLKVSVVESVLLSILKPGVPYLIPCIFFDFVFRLSYTPFISVKIVRYPHIRFNSSNDFIK